nr:hypothetical protein [Tanacetum cinerariifolium]
MYYIARTCMYHLQESIMYDHETLIRHNGCSRFLPGVTAKVSQSRQRPMRRYKNLHHEPTPTVESLDWFESLILIKMDTLKEATLETRMVSPLAESGNTLSSNKNSQVHDVPFGYFDGAMRHVAHQDHGVKVGLDVAINIVKLDVVGREHGLIKFSGRQERSKGVPSFSKRAKMWVMLFFALARIQFFDHMSKPFKYKGSDALPTEKNMQEIDISWSRFATLTHSTS